MSARNAVPFDETAVWAVLALKQLSYGFARLDEIDDGDPSPRMMFYFSSIYNQLAVLFLLDKQESDPIGGALYPALRRHGHEDLLNEIAEILDKPFGATTFGNVVRLFRNKIVTHTTYSQTDLDKISELVNMQDPENQVHWYFFLVEIRDAAARLMIAIARATGRPMSDFGIGLA